ncbi:hypothetical protein BKA93DRAFT_40211 [Sparassis latifolia]
MSKAVKLPVGPMPGWELEDNNGEGRELRSVAESLVVLQSLRESRRRWLSSIFPKFSTKPRGGKPPDVVPPPHTIKAHGRYDLTIGPHTFPNTAFYEVHYIPQPVSAPAPTLHPTHFLSQGTSMQQLPGTSVPAVAGQSFNMQPTPEVFVTPDLISQVNAASLSNPTLANLLQMAASGRATPDQMKTLGLLIQSLGAANLAAPPLASPTPTQVSYTRRDFDIVIEFTERPSDKWVFPRGPVVCERTKTNETSTAILSNGGIAASVQQDVVTFYLSKVPRTLWDVLITWSGGEQGMEDSRRRLVEISAKAAPRTYLQHRLPEGPLISQIQSVVTPYATKPIAPVHADRTKRKAATRKVTIDTTGSMGGNTSKRRQPSKPKAIAQPPPIACRSCGQTDVPLMMGGRYCRTCIEAGKAVHDIPQVPVAAGSMSSAGPWVGSTMHVFPQTPGGHTAHKSRRPSGLATPALHPSSSIVPNPSALPVNMQQGRM